MIGGRSIQIFLNINRLTAGTTMTISVAFGDDLSAILIGKFKLADYDAVTTALTGVKIGLSPLEAQWVVAEIKHQIEIGPP